MDNLPAPSHIRKARKRAKRTQQALGILVGTKCASVSGWEKGRFRPDPTRADPVLDLAPADCSAEALLGRRVRIVQYLQLTA